MLKKSLIIGIAIAFLISCWGGNMQTASSNKGLNRDTTYLAFTVEENHEWTHLFYRNHEWFGADGIFSIPLSGVDTADGSDSTLFIFSDSMVGDVVDGKIIREYPSMNNTVAILIGNEANEENIFFAHGVNSNGHPAALFIPNTPSFQPGDYYWLGDGFVNQELNNNLYIFAYQMRNMDSSDWSFAQVSSVIIKLPEGSRPPFAEQVQIETPFIIRGEVEQETGTLGAGIFVNTKEAGAPNPDGYVYVYGVMGRNKKLLVSRVLPADFEDFDKWSFWDGADWTDDFNNIGFATTNVSNELSVTPLSDGRYALVFQVNGMGSKIGLRLGLTPYGPFGPIIEVWDCKEAKQKNYFTYNAKAHPHLSNPGELLISYNVNAFNFREEITKDPHLYRPRFVKIKHE